MPSSRTSLGTDSGTFNAMLIATISSTFVLIALSFVQLQRWRIARHAALMRRRHVRVRDIEHVTAVKGAIVIKLRSGRVMLASNVLGWSPGLRTRLHLLGVRGSATSTA